MNLIDQINSQLLALQLLPLNPEQVECLSDSFRLDAARRACSTTGAMLGMRSYSASAEKGFDP
jgi:hypothetical protein